MNESQNKFRLVSYKEDVQTGVIGRPTRLGKINKSVTDWFYNRTSGLFMEPDDRSDNYSVQEATVVAVMQTGESVEWSLDQSVGDMIEANLRSSAKLLIPSFVSGLFNKIYRYLYITLLTDEVLDHEESDLEQKEQIKKGFIREAGQKVINTAMILGFKARPVFFGFLGIYRKVTRKVKSVVANVLGSAFRKFLRKAVFNLLSLFRPRISHIRGPDS